MKKNILIFCALLFASSVNCQKKVVCYWFAEIDASQIDAKICTHIIYSFLGVDAQGGLNHLWRSESQGLGYISKLVALKSQNANLKVIAAVGGYNLDLVTAWSTMAGNSNSRLNFAKNVLAFIQKNKLNGIDIDWEYPNHYEDKPQDKANFVLLLQQLKQTLGSSYSVSVALGSGQWRTGLSYDIPKIFAACDFVNLMTYDLHGSWESVTGIHAALYRSSLDNSPSNVHESVQLLLNQGINKDKLIMGIPTYGNAFRLANAANNGVGAPASGAGSKKYNEICLSVRSGAYTYRWENTQRVPYAFSGTFWIGFDDVRSVTEKANYIKSQNLGGAMFWSFDSDDYSGACGSGKFPLIATVSNIVKSLQDSQPEPEPEPKPDTTTKTTSRTTTPTSNPGKFVCPGNGLFKDPADCSKFYSCTGRSGTAYSMACGSPLLFNVATNTCDWAYNVHC